MQRAVVKDPANYPHLSRPMTAIRLYSYHSTITTIYPTCHICTTLLNLSSSNNNNNYNNNRNALGNTLV
jgi:hypothetical protein